jgi:hypothetical protein
MTFPLGESPSFRSVRMSSPVASLTSAGSQINQPTGRRRHWSQANTTTRHHTPEAVQKRQGTQAPVGHHCHRAPACKTAPTHTRTNNA